MTARNHEIRVKLSGEELEMIKKKAKKLGMQESSFLRYLGLKAKVEEMPINFK